MVRLLASHAASGAARVVVGIAAAGTLASCSSPAPPTPHTAAVTRTSLSAGVSSTGSLAPLTERNLGFPRGGRLTSVLVKVGDRVDAGQVLATVDPLPARQELAAQRAQLRAQLAMLEQLTDSPAVDDAEESLDEAQDIVNAVRKQAEALDNADGAAVADASAQVNAAEQAERNAHAGQSAACGASPSSSQCSAAQATYIAAQQKTAEARAVLRAAQHKQALDRASSKVAIETAEQGVRTVRNAFNSSRSAHPHTVDQQEALVAATRAAVVQAEHDLDDATLRAPAAGTVTALNGAVGEYLAPSGGTSALAPGTEAAIPGASGSTSGGSAASPLAAAGPARPGGTQFLVLSDTDQYLVVATFNENDAALIGPDQEVQVTFDAIRHLTIPGTVTAVSPAGTAIAGVISYYVTVALSEDDSRLRGGLTANVQVVEQSASDVLTVPTSAVRNVRGNSVVTVVEGDRRRTITFEPGITDNGRTEVVSGLREGQRVLLPFGQQGRDQS